MATGQAVGRPTATEATFDRATASGSTTSRTLGARFADVVNVKDFGAACDGSTDDIAGAQAALNRANALGGAHVFVPASMVISSALVIYSNTWLEVAPHATVIFKAGSTGRMLRNAAVTAQRSVSDAAITSGQTTLTSATAAFTSADVGRTVIVNGAGAINNDTYGGGAAMLVANIVVVTNGTTVTLSAAAATTVSGAACAIYNRDTNIKVTGGTWARGSAGGGILDHTLFFRHVDGLYFADARVTGGAAGHYFAISPGDVTDVVAERLSFSNAAAGVQVQGPAARITVREIRGDTSDDTIAFVARDYVGIDVVGDISDVSLDGVYSTSAIALVKVLGGSGTKVRSVTLRNLFGTALRGVSVVDDGTGPSDVAGLLIDGVRIAVSSVIETDLLLTASAGKDVTVRNVMRRSTATNGGMISLGTWESVLIDGVQHSSAVSMTGSVVVGVNGTVGDLTIKHVRLGGDANQILYVATGKTANRVEIADSAIVSATVSAATALHVLGTVDFYKLSNITLINGGNLMWLVSGATAPAGQVSNCSAKGTGRLADIGPVSTDVTLTNVLVDSLSAGAFFASGAAALVIRGSGFTRRNYNGAGVEVSSFTGSIRVINPDFVLDLATTGLQQNQGDTLWSGNAASAPGLGHVMSDGSGWHSIYGQSFLSISQSGGGSKTPSAYYDVTRFTVSDATGFTINAPAVAAAPGRIFTFIIYNAVGGAMGTVTWDAAYKFSGATPPASPTSSRHVTITFHTEAATYHEISRAVDVVN